METMEVGGSVVRVDARATREAYRNVEPSAGRCGCSGCANWDEAVRRSMALPSEVAALLARLGIDPGKSAEQCWFGEVEPRLHLYNAWYHGLGVLETAGDPLLLPSGGQVYVLDDRTLAADPFRDAPDVVQVEIVVSVPWLIDAAPE